MERPERTHMRMRVLDGRTFVLSAKVTSCSYMATSIKSLANSIVAPVTTDQTVQVSAVDEWEMVFDYVQSRASSHEG